MFVTTNQHAYGIDTTQPKCNRHRDPVVYSYVVFFLLCPAYSRTRLSPECPCVVEMCSAGGNRMRNISVR